MKKQKKILSTAKGIRRAAIAAGACLYLLGVPAAMSQIIEPEYRYGGRLWSESDEGRFRSLFDSVSRRADRLRAGYPHSPSVERSLMESGEDAYQAEKWDESLHYFRRLRREFPHSTLVAHSLYGSGEVEFIRKDYIRAADYFGRAAERAGIEAEQRSHSSYPEIGGNALYWQGTALHLEKKTKGAKAAFELCVERYPAHPRADDALFSLGVIAEEENKLEEALSRYQQAARTYPQGDVVLASLVRAAHFEIRLRKPVAALGTLERASTILAAIEDTTQVSPYPPQLFAQGAAEEILLLQGEAQIQSNLPDEALSSLTKLTEKYPASPLYPKARLMMGRAYLDKKECGKALPIYDALIATKEIDVLLTERARFYRAIALKQCDRREEAYNDLSAMTIRSDFPAMAEALLELGQMYYEDKEYDQARKTLERASRERAEPRTQALTALLLGNTALESGRFATASTAFASAQETAASTPLYLLPQKERLIEEARYKRGIADIRGNRNREGISVLTAFIADYPKSRYGEEAFFWLAEGYYSEALMLNAEQHYLDFLKKYPSSSRKEEVLYGLGWSYFRRKDFTKATTTFERLMREFPRTEFAVDVLTRKGDGYWLNKMYRPAADSYRQAALRGGKSEQGQYSAYQLGRALYAMDAYGEAVTAMESFVRKYPTSTLAPDALFTVGWVYFQQRNNTAAITSFSEFIQRFPSSPLAPRVQYAIGDAWYNLGEYDKAISAYRLTAANYPRSQAAVDAITSLQYTLSGLGQDEEAALVADEFVKANPDSYSAQEVRFKNADMFLSGGRYSSAAAEYEAYLRQNPEGDRSAEAMYQLARSRFNMGETAEAFAMLAGIEKKFPTSEYSHRALLEAALLRRDRGEMEEAERLFNYIQKQYPGAPSAIQSGFEQAFFAERNGDTAAAMERYLKLADDYPESEYGARSRFRVGMHYRSLQQYDTARVHFEAVARRTDELGAEAQFRIGEMHFRENENEEAAAAFLAVRDRFSMIEDWHTLALINLGEAYSRLDRKEEAREVYRLVVTLRKEDDFGKEAAERLRRLGR